MWRGRTKMNMLHMYEEIENFANIGSLYMNVEIK